MLTGQEETELAKLRALIKEEQLARPPPPGAEVEALIKAVFADHLLGEPQAPTWHIRVHGQCFIGRAIHRLSPGGPTPQPLLAATYRLHSPTTLTSPARCPCLLLLQRPTQTLKNTFSPTSSSPPANPTLHPHPTPTAASSPPTQCTQSLPPPPPPRPRPKPPSSHPLHPQPAPTPPTPAGGPATSPPPRVPTCTPCCRTPTTHPRRSWWACCCCAWWCSTPPPSSWRACPRTRTPRCTTGWCEYGSGVRQCNT